MNEIIDIFDANHSKIGVEDRLVAHKDGHWHQTFHCWIAGIADNSQYVLLQMRSQSKKSYPNMLDITAAGHLASGEAPSDGLRELEEELGVNVVPSQLRYLGIKHDIADEANGNQNREFAHVYLLRDDRPIAEYRLQEDEVSGLAAMTITDGLKLFSGETHDVQCRATRIVDGRLTEFIRSVSVSDLIPRVDSYYLKIFIMAQAFLRGDRYLSI